MNRKQRRAWATSAARQLFASRSGTLDKLSERVSLDAGPGTRARQDTSQKGLGSHPSIPTGHGVEVRRGTAHDPRAHTPGEHE